MATMLTSTPNYGELIQSDRISGRVYYDPAIFREELKKSGTANGSMSRMRAKFRSRATTLPVKSDCSR